MAIIFQNDFSNQSAFNEWKNSFTSKWKWVENPSESRLGGVANLNVGFVQYCLTSKSIPLDGNSINGSAVSISFDADFELSLNTIFKIRISNDAGKLWYDYDITLANQKNSIRKQDFYFDLIPELVPMVGKTMDILVQMVLETPINDITSKVNISSIIVESDRSGGGDGTNGVRTPKPPAAP